MATIHLMVQRLDHPTKERTLQELIEAASDSAVRVGFDLAQQLNLFLDVQVSLHLRMSEQSITHSNGFGFKVLRIGSQQF